MSLYVGTYEEWNQRIVGEVGRLAAVYGADGFFSIGPGAMHRRDVETLSFLTIEDAIKGLPGAMTLNWVALETGGVPLVEFVHPEDAVYLLGPNASYLPKNLLDRMDYKVTVEGGVLSTPAVAAITLHHRAVSMDRALT